MRVFRIFAILLLCTTFGLVSAQEATQERTTVTATLYDENVLLNLQYPAEWFVLEHSDQIVLSNGLSDELVPGEMAINVFSAVIEDFDEIQLIEYFQELEPSMDYDEIETFTVNGFSAGALRFEAEEDYEGLIWAINYGDDAYVIINAKSLNGEMDVWLDEILALAETITLTEVVLSETYTAEDGRLSVNYPEGWATTSSYPYGVRVGATEASLDLWFPHKFEAGDVHAQIMYGTLDELMDFELDEGVEMTPVEIMEYAVDSDDTAGLNISNIVGFKHHGYDGAAFIIVVMDTQSVVYMNLIDLGDGNYIAGQIHTVLGELEDNMALFYAMLNTLEITEAN